MRKNVPWWLTLGWLVILGLALTGCGGGSGMQAAPPTKSKTDLLLASGFKQIYPNTPQMKARLQAMPQNRMLTASRGNKVFYVYADAAGSGSLYASNEQHYQAYRRLAAQSRLAAEETAAARIDESMNMSWDEWGEAGPW